MSADLPVPERIAAKLPSFTKWYDAARAEAMSRYGIRGIPVDTYKQQWVKGLTVMEGVANIVRQMEAIGRRSAGPTEYPEWQASAPVAFPPEATE